MAVELRGARVLVTGAGGFLGRYLAAALAAEGADVIPWDRAVDLVEHRETVRQVVALRPDYAFHLAGHNGGIDFNCRYPADIFLRNTAMALNLLAGCAAAGARKVLSTVSSCAYDSREHEPREEAFLCGRPHETAAGHGDAKRNALLGSGYFRRQYGLHAVCACPTTLYGPGDSFDPERTKVMGAMIKRFVDAALSGQREVTCWGSGRVLREFLYVQDCAGMLIAAMRLWDDSDRPLNLGTGQEHTVQELAETVARCVGFTGAIRWDTTKPDGQYRKRLDLTLMRRVLPDVPVTPLEEGIRRTAVHYRETVAGRVA